MGASPQTPEVFGDQRSGLRQYVLQCVERGDATQDRTDDVFPNETKCECDNGRAYAWKIVVATRCCRPKHSGRDDGGQDAYGRVA